MERFHLQQKQAPGDVVMMTGAVRDLLRSLPSAQVTVQTSYPELWQGNPLVQHVERAPEGARVIDMHYPAIHRSNLQPGHFAGAYQRFLEAALGVAIPLTSWKGDLYLSEDERSAPPARFRAVLPRSYWLLAAGGKKDFTAKWWTPSHWQEVVELLAGRVSFVQVAGPGDYVPDLTGVVNLSGQTSLRELVGLVHHSDGVISLVSLCMHLAAAVPVKPGQRPLRPCVVIAGGREPPHWEAYPGHQFLHTVGMLDCCASGGCWRSRCQQLGDGHYSDHRNLCEQRVQVGTHLRIARCMDMIWPEDAVRAVNLYLTGWDRPVHP